MKHFCYLVLCCVLILLFGEKLHADGIELKDRTGIFFPTTRLIRKIYHNTIPLYQLELSYRRCSPWSFWANVGYLTDHGHSLGERDPTRLYFFPAGMGINYHRCIWCNLEAYLGAGISYSTVCFKDDSPYVQQHTKKCAFGVMAKSGIVYQYSRCGSLELFLDYLYSEFHFTGSQNNVERHSLNLSGLLLGIGLGYTF